MATYGDDVRIQILVKRDTSQGRFQDAIYLPVAEFEAMKDEDVEALKDARVSAWLAAVETAKTAPPHKPTKAELEAESLFLRTRLADVSTKLDAEAAKDLKAEAAVKG